MSLSLGEAGLWLAGAGLSLAAGGTAWGYAAEVVGTGTGLAVFNGIVWGILVAGPYYAAVLDDDGYPRPWTRCGSRGGGLKRRH